MYNAQDLLEKMKKLLDNEKEYQRHLEEAESLRKRMREDIVYIEQTTIDMSLDEDVPVEDKAAVTTGFFKLQQRLMRKAKKPQVEEVKSVEDFLKNLGVILASKNNPNA